MLPSRELHSTARARSAPPARAGLATGWGWVCCVMRRASRLPCPQFGGSLGEYYFVERATFLQVGTGQWSGVFKCPPVLR